MAIKINKSKVDPIIKQSHEEYEHDLKYRNRREQDWRDVDDLYYGKKKKSLVTRANVHVPKMQGTIDTFVSKIDDAPFLDYEHVEEGDKPGARRMSAFLKRQMNVDDWDMVDIVGKKEAALYGRAIFKKFSDSKGGFTDHFELVDALDFVIDPLAGGLFPEQRARHMGQDNIIKSIWDLKDKKQYDQEVVEEMATELKSDGDADNKFRSLQARRQALNLTEAVLVSQDSVRLVEWYTHFEGKRWYVLFSPEHMKAIRIEKVEDVLGFDEFPFSTWALFPRLSEFWTPGLGELVKEPNIIQNILLSQMLDNNAFRNYGMKAYDTNRIENPAELTPRPMGKIAVDGDPSKAIKDITFPAISEAIQAYNLVETIFARETGVTNQAKGLPHSKRMSATEFAGLIDEVADRFFTSNRTYKHALRRIAHLYQLGVSANMTKDMAVKIQGASGYDWDKVSVDDAKKQYDIIVTSGSEKESERNIMRDRFREYRAANAKNERLNQAFLDEKEAEMVGLKPHEVQRLMNPEIEGDWQILAEAASENEILLKRTHEPNRGATSGHVQKHLDFARDTNNLTPEQVARILSHAQAEMEMVIKNEEMRAKKKIEELKQQKQQKQQREEGDAGAQQPPQPQLPQGPGPGRPPLPVQPTAGLNPQPPGLGRPLPPDIAAARQNAPVNINQ